ncbi:MAG: efflux RND transporter periplasmic adaptor subunit [Acidobacteria bacterium]|nr:efflux RND transporter periplasmic adaptor subunit [Acidobacteriota bacterium]
MRRSAIAILLLAAVGAATGFYVVRSNERRSSMAEPRTVRPERRMVPATVNATGTVRLRVGAEVRVGSQLSGIVKKLNVTVGSHVAAGAIIAEIDDAPVRARLAQAEAQAELDRAGMQRAQVNAARAQELAAQGLIPVQQQQDLQLAFQEAAAKYEKSLRDRDLVKVDLGYVSIRAPISGTIASVSTQEGETVAASFTAPTFVTIIGDNALQLVAMVDETDIAAVRRGNPVRFTVDSYPAQDFFGAVESIAPKATIVSGVVNYEVNAGIRRDARLLKPDMTANVAIQTAQHESLVLPADALRRDGEQTYVLVRGPAGPERRSVVPGPKEAGMVEIRKGISQDDVVLLLPPEQPKPADPRE